MTSPPRSQPGTELAQRIQTHLALKDSSPGFHLSDDDLTLIAERLAGPDREALRDLVDIVWNEATESTAVPSTKWANKLIDRWNTRAGARGARVNEISRLRAGLQAVVDCKDSVARSAIREHCASILSQSPEDARSGVQTESDGLTKAMDIVGDMRQSGAGRFDDPKYCGQRGCDRADALYDVYGAIRAARDAALALSSADHQPSCGRRGGTCQCQQEAECFYGPLPSTNQLRNGDS